MLGRLSSWRMWIHCGLLAFMALAYGLLGRAWAEAPRELKFSKRCLMIGPNEGCAGVDVNRDNVLDIIAGTHWYAGPDFVPRPLRDIDEMGEYLSQNGDHPYDVDGDGWIDVISMRNRLVHAYFDIDLDLLWSTATDDLPDLISKIEKIISEA